MLQGLISTATNGPREGIIYSKIAAVMREADAIGKDRKNVQQNYKFRGIDDVYNSMHDIMAKHGIFCVPTIIDMTREERTTKSGSLLIYTVLTIIFTFYAEDGSSVQAVIVGEGMDSGDKSCNKAMSVAQKYSFLQVFAIPTEDLKDPENDSPEPAPKKEEDNSELFKWYDQTIVDIQSVNSIEGIDAIWTRNKAEFTKLQKLDGNRYKQLISVAAERKKQLAN